MSSSTEEQTEPQPLKKVMVARQPIYNNRMGIFGYELLFRSPDGNHGNFKPVQATSQVISSTILDFDIDSFSQHRKLVFNVTRAVIDVFEDIPIPPDQVVLDLPDNVVIDEKLISKLKELNR